MKTRKLFRYHSKFYKYFRKILFGSNKPEEKLNIYKKILEIIKKLKSYELRGRIKYQTPIDEIAEVIQRDKTIIEEKIKAGKKQFNY